MVSAILTLCSGLVTAWNQAHSVWNAPPMVQAKVAELHQQHKDAWSNLDAALSDKYATPADHEAALNKLRLAQS
jgi:hypothetical protein